MRKICLNAENKKLGQNALNNGGGGGVENALL